MVTNNPILQMFARSPIQPMQQHIAKAQACASELLPFFDAVLKKDWILAEKIQLKISALEVEADDMKRDIRKHLPKSIFLPVPRTDLLELLRMQDKIANRTKDIAGIMLGRKMEIPDAISTQMLEFVRAAVSTSEQAYQAMNELDELVTSGFRGHEVDLVEKMLLRLDELEHQADQLEREIRAVLFSIERELYPVDVMFLYQTIHWIGDLADRAQQTGSRLHLLLAR